MNPIEQQETQDQSQTDFGGLNPDQMAAALSFATHQGEQFLPQQQMAEPMEEESTESDPQEGPKEEMEENPSDEMAKGLDVKFEGMKAELTQEIKNEFSEIKKMLEGSLKP